MGGCFADVGVALLLAILNAENTADEVLINFLKWIIKKIFIKTAANKVVSKQIKY